jgi:hypothetical protein
VDFKVKMVIMGGKKLKLAIWDTGISFNVNIIYAMVDLYFKFLYIFSKLVKCNELSWQERFRTLDKFILQRSTRHHHEYVLVVLVHAVVHVGP